MAKNLYVATRWASWTRGGLVMLSLEKPDRGKDGTSFTQVGSSLFRPEQFEAIYGFLPEGGKVYRVHLFSQVVVG